MQASEALPENSAVTPARALVVSLHDVSPRTWGECRQILDALDHLGIKQCSLLVIPDHHHRGHFLADEGFCAWLREQAERGHEIVIHGYYHQRERRPGETALGKLTTRFYTADEGEFYDIDRAAATTLVKSARVDFQKLGLDPTGFIAPAWLLSQEAETALRDCGCEYTTRLGSVLDLKQARLHHSQSLVWSVRSAWRRKVSAAWNALLFRRLATNPLLRVSIHPVDINHAAIWSQISSLIASALKDRTPHSYQSWLSQVRKDVCKAPLG